MRCRIEYMIWVSCFLELSPAFYFSLTPNNAIISWFHQRIRLLIHSTAPGPIIFQWGLFPVQTVTDLNETNIDVCRSWRLPESARRSQMQTLLLHNSRPWERSPRILHPGCRPSRAPGRWEQMRYHQSHWLLATHGALGLSLIPGDESAVKLLTNLGVNEVFEISKIPICSWEHRGNYSGPAAQSPSLAISLQPVV